MQSENRPQGEARLGRGEAGMKVRGLGSPSSLCADSSSVPGKSVENENKFVPLILVAVLLLTASLASCVGQTSVTKASSPGPGPSSPGPRTPNTLGVNPTSLNFGSVIVGTTSAAQTVMVTNSSSGSITVRAITISGPFASTGVPLPAALNAGQGLTLNVTFTPTASGATRGTLTITSTGGNSP